MEPVPQAVVGLVSRTWRPAARRRATLWNSPITSVALLRAQGLQARSRQRVDGGGELVHLDDEVAEPGADLHRSVGRPVDQLERDDLLAGEL